MKADWKSVMTAPPESLVNALSMMCPFEPAEKQALLEAPSWVERVATLVALLEISTAPGPGYARTNLSHGGSIRKLLGDPGLPAYPHHPAL